MGGRGPAPKDPTERRRRNKTTTRLQLPAEGRKGDPPEWPLPVGEEPNAIHDRELSLWAELWALPQAVAWDHIGGYTHEVAMYCRHMTLGGFGDLDSAKEARMRSDRLGLTPSAMRSLQWEIVTDETAEAREGKQESSTRPKLRAVDPNSA